jgi:hypothetical protein
MGCTPEVVARLYPGRVPERFRFFLVNGIPTLFPFSDAHMLPQFYERESVDAEYRDGGFNT